MAICFVNPMGCHVTADHVHMPGQAFLIFFCHKLFLQCIQMNSFITYMLSSSTSSATNCGHLFVVISSFSWDVCLCNFLIYWCDKHSFTISSLISQSVVWNSQTVLQMTYNDNMSTHIQVFYSVLPESLLLLLYLDTFHNMVKLGFHYLFLLIFYHMMRIYIGLHL